MPAWSAILRTVVALYPWAAKTSAAVSRSSRRRSGEAVTWGFFLVGTGPLSSSPARRRRYACRLLTETTSPVMYEE